MGFEVNEADLRNFMRQCSGSTSFIPAPVGNFQVVMMNCEAGRRHLQSNLWRTLLQQHLLVILEQMVGNEPLCS